jgi:Family of unknown function (DUF6879)
MLLRNSSTNSNIGKLGVIAKIGISVLAGLVALVISLVFSSKVGSSTQISIGVSVFIGGVAFVAQFLVDVERRLDQSLADVERRLDQSLADVERQVDQARVEVDRRMEDVRQDIDHRVDAAQRALAGLEAATAKHIEETRKMITTEFAKINAATELFAAVEASALKTDVMTQLVKNATTVPKTPKLIFDFAQGEIARLSQYLRELGQGGAVTYEGEDRDWLLGLARFAAASIDATSLTTVDAGGKGFIDGGLWNSDLGQQYLEAQREAVRRGVVIRRIFIVDRPGLQNDDPEFTKILRQHKAIGVQVRTMLPRETTGNHPDRFFDFIVFDKAISYQSRPASRPSEQSRPIIIETALVTNPTRVQERIQRFKDLWEEAQDFEPETKE